MSIHKQVSAAVVFLLGLCPLAQAERRQAAPLVLTVVAPSADEGDSGADLNRDDSHLDVILENVSRRPLKVWTGNTDLSLLTLEVIALDGKTLPAPVTLVPFIVSGGNGFASTGTVEPGQKIVHEVRFRSLFPWVNGSIQTGTFLTASHPSSAPGLFPVAAQGATQETATIRAVFHDDDWFPSSPDLSARAKGVWVGRAVSAATDVLVFLRPTDSAQIPILPASSPSVAGTGPNKPVKK